MPGEGPPDRTRRKHWVSSVVIAHSCHQGIPCTLNPNYADLQEYKTAMKSGKIQHCKFEECLGCGCGKVRESTRPRVKFTHQLAGIVQCKYLCKAVLSA